MKALGSESFQQRYHLKNSYVAGAMYKGISSPEMVIRLARVGCLSFLGTGGLGYELIEKNIKTIQSELKNNENFGVNFLHTPYNPNRELDLAKLYIKNGVQCLEASAFMQVTKALIYYRAKGLVFQKDQSIEIKNRIIAKISRLEVLKEFLSLPSEEILLELIEDKLIDQTEASLMRRVSIVDDIILEADSGGHTDKGRMIVLLPTVVRLIHNYNKIHGPEYKIHVGAAGGIGTPEAAAAAFILGADFIVTGSINQCTPEAATSSLVKDMLQEITLHDTTYVPAGDMFQAGAKVQVMKRGLFFPSRANQLYEYWKMYESLDSIPLDLREKIEQTYFKRSFEEIFEDVRTYYDELGSDEIHRAERNPKYKMSLVFRWYFFVSTQFAIEGKADRKVDFQIQCGPALGAFNEWVKGTQLENWRFRHVDHIAEKLIVETKHYLKRQWI